MRDRREFLTLGLSACAALGALGVLGPRLWRGRSVLRLIAPAGDEPYRTTTRCMGTFVSIAVYDPPRPHHRHAVRRAIAEIAAVEALMTTFSSDSQLSQVNRAAGRDSLAVDPRLCEVLAAARDMGDMSGGVFDVSVLPLLRQYGLRGGRSRPPTAAEIEAARSRVDYRAIRVDTARQRAQLATPGAEVDLGGIAKGYAVDRAVEVLRRHGVERAVLDAGGDLFALGSPPTQDRWRLGIQDPWRADRIVATVGLRDQAIATSGSYERASLLGGERFGHLLDPARGRPATPMLSASVVAPTAMQADALSTAAYLMGTERGAGLVHETGGAGHVFLTGPPRPSGGKGLGFAFHTSAELAGLVLRAPGVDA